ncbi:hypothetical protein ACO2Q0_02605 [Phenylobacterium sp. VNQ135]|uniref:hypothetical protein n=1 Tax=Phenylobacterium sp. VNQ135 TaxID=3400922 RepID=UPI003C09CA5F
MTTIAYRDGVLAADTLINASGEVLGYTPKIGKAGRVLYGASGTTAWCWAFRSWVSRGCYGPPPERCDDKTGGFIVAPNDDLIVFHCEGVERRSGLPFYADGSGANYALGAMQMGADPVQAVKAAMVWDRKTGGEITVLKREG